MTETPTAAIIHGSRMRSRSEAIEAAMSSLGRLPPPLLRRALRAVPGWRLIPIIVRLGSGDLTHREPDGEHQERCNLIRDETGHGAVTNSEVGQGIRLLN